MERYLRSKRSLDRRRSRLRTSVFTLNTTPTSETRICSRNTELSPFSLPLTKCTMRWEVTTEYPETESRSSRLSSCLRTSSESKNQDVFSIRTPRLWPSQFGRSPLDHHYLSTELTLLKTDHQLSRVEFLLNFETNKNIYIFFIFNNYYEKS